MNRQVGAAIEENFSSGKLFESEAALFALANIIKRTLQELMGTSPTLKIVVNALKPSDQFAHDPTDLVFSDNDIIRTM